MQYKRTNGIVLTRVDYGEADRVVTFLTSTEGKVTVMAKGVRKINSKLAGGVELLSESELMLAPSRGGMSTLISARPVDHLKDITKDINRTMAAYDILKLIHKNTEDNVEPGYYTVLKTALTDLNNLAVPTDIIWSWLIAQVLLIAGNAPNVTHTKDEAELELDKKYSFDYDDMHFFENDNGEYDTRTIKCMRLLFSPHPPSQLLKIGGFVDSSSAVRVWCERLREQHLN